MRIAVYSCDSRELACPQLRFVGPAARQGGAVELEWAARSSGSRLAIDQGALERADALAIARFFPQAATWPFVEQLLASGRPVVYELDDLLTEIPDSNPFAATARRIRPYVVELLGRATAVTVSTEALARELRSSNAAVHVIPNGIDADRFFAPVRPRRGALAIAYAGTDTHAHDLASIEESLLRVTRRHPGRVRFVLFGCTTQRLAQLPETTVLPFERSYAAYAATLRSAGIDLIVAPLEDTRFNRCKSAVKWLELSAAGVPGIWADLEPYRAAVEDGETGLLRPPAPELWYEAICELVEDEEQRLRLARQAQAAVLAEHAPSRGAARFLEVYRNLCPGRVLPVARAAPRATIVIPVWNRAELTERCLAALFAAEETQSYEVLVVDNGSSDGTAALLERHAGRVRVLRNQTNEGFGPACNRAAAAARGEYVVFLNNDTQPLAGWLDALMAAADADAGIGIVGSRLLFPDDTIQHAGLAISRRFLTPYGIWRGVPRDAPMVSRRRELQAVTGACMLVRTALFRELGGFDTAYRNGFEDVDLCLRAGERGWRVLYEPASTLYHLESQTPGRKDADLPNLRRYGERWGRPSRVDEDRLYLEDGFRVRTAIEDGEHVLRFFAIEDDETRARWALVAEVQRVASRAGAAAARAGLAVPARWPSDPEVLAWGAALCAELGDARLEAEFRRRASEPARPQAAGARGAPPRAERRGADWLRRGIEIQLEQS